MLFDTHAHLNFEAFNEQWTDVIADCQQHGVEMTLVGSQMATSRKAVDIAERYATGVYAAIGLHPTHTPGSPSHPEAFDLDVYRKLGSSKKVVAVGETGIDFFHQAENFKSQEAVFMQQIWLAKELDLAIVVHGRNSKDGKVNAYGPIYDILKKEKVERAVVHCFGGTWEEAQRFLELGLCIGITGIVTFPKTEQLAEVVRNAPLDRLLIETDCPYLAPVPHRGKTNYPQYVRFVAEKIAELKNVSFDEVANATTHNAKKFYRV